MKRYIIFMNVWFKFILVFVFFKFIYKVSVVCKILGGFWVDFYKLILYLDRKFEGL